MLKNIDDLSNSSDCSDEDHDDPNQLYYNEEIDPVDAGSGGSSRDYQIEEEESKIGGQSNDDFNCSSNSVQSSSTGNGEQVSQHLYILNV